MKIRAKFTKLKDLKYISHLDLMRVFQRAFRRANIPVKYSEGFNPHPQFSLATALALGVTSDGEYMDVDLEEYMSPEDFKERLNSVLPNGIKILKAVSLEDKNSIVSLVRWSTYIIGFKVQNEMTLAEIAEEVEKFLSSDELILIKEKKKGNKITVKENNVRDRIKELFPLSYQNDIIVLKTTLRTGSQGNLRPEELVELLEKYTSITIIRDSLKIHRLELFIEKGGVISLPI